MTKQASIFTATDELAQVLGARPEDLFRRGKCPMLGLAYIEFHSIPEPNSGCWLWLGTLDRDNYPRTRRRDIDDQYAHRYSLMCVHGPLGDLHALHKCDNPICVNPDHLFAGTQNDNTQDMISKGRDRHPRGEDNGLAVLSEQDVRSIRAEYVFGSRSSGPSALGKKYGVTRGNIKSILAGRSWGWLQ